MDNYYFSFGNRSVFLFCRQTMHQIFIAYSFWEKIPLTPKRRSNLGNTRVLTEDAIEEIYQIKKMFLRLNATQIHVRLVQENLIQVLKDAVAAYEIPNKLYVDSGAPYKNRQLDMICASIGIVLLHTPVHSATGEMPRWN